MVDKKTGINDYLTMKSLGNALKTALAGIHPTGNEGIRLGIIIGILIIHPQRADGLF